MKELDNMKIGWTEVIAAYAAIVATGALFLEIRRWIESGPRLRLRVMEKAQMFGVGLQDPNTYISATVTNIGALPTTLRIMAFEFYKTPWKWLLRKSTGGALVKLPGAMTGQELPYLLTAGTQWTGQAKRDEGVEKLLSENWAAYLCVYSSHTNRPVRYRMKRLGS
ncbi:MAG: hypothetical protein AB7R90_10440 [Reyranellaceae bacterium]